MDKELLFAVDLADATNGRVNEVVQALQRIPPTDCGAGTRTLTTRARISRAANYTTPQREAKECSWDDSVRHSWEHTFVMRERFQRRVNTNARVSELLAAGLSQVEIAAALGRSKSTVAYHARTLGKAPDQRCNRRYDWAAVQRFYDDGHSARECQGHFGFTSQTWHAAMPRGAIVTRP